MGDFNQIMNPIDHSASHGFNVDRATRDFRESLLDAGLLESSFRGSTFNWWNKRRETPIANKINRILINDQWPVQFSSFVGFFGSADFTL